jgi:glycosyltransferase involved in cell wall biosynthesis
MTSVEPSLTHRLKVLVITPWVPSKTRPRSYRFLQTLSSQCELAIVAAVWNDSERQDLAALPVQRAVGVPMSKLGAVFRAATGLLSGRSLQQAYVSSSQFRGAIRRELAEFRPDVCYFNVLRTAQFVNEVGTERLVIDLDEFRSAYYRQMSSHTKNLAWKVLAKVEARRMERAEQDVLERFSSVLVSAPLDRSRGGNVTLVRSAHAMSPGKTSAWLPDMSVLFVGRLSYRANVEAVRWFAREVMPGIVDKVPDARLYIVGNAPVRSVRGLASGAVEVVGPVDEVRPYYEGAAVSIVPVTMATGVQMKLIEALSVGTATVASSRTARQAGVHDRTECLIADTAEQWRDAVVELLLDRHLRQQVGDAGARWAEAEHGLASVAQVLGSAVLRR